MDGQGEKNDTVGFAKTTRGSAWQDGMNEESQEGRQMSATTT